MEKSERYQLRTLAWSRYWAGGALHSCPGSFEGNYPPAIEAFWRSALADAGSWARVLDIGTGNGAIPKLLVDHQQAPTLPRIDAIDLSQVEPRWLQQVNKEAAARLQFHKCVAAEALPFEKAAFSHIVSQFGFEYAERDAALAELLRVAAPQSTVALIMHHQDSRPVQVGREESEHVRFLLASEGLLAGAMALGAVLAQACDCDGWLALQNNAAAHALRVRYNTCQKLLAERAANASFPDVLHQAAASVAHTLSQAPLRGGARIVNELHRLRGALEDLLLRLDELVSCSLSADELQRISARLSSAGYRCKLGRIEVGGYLMGWSLMAWRNVSAEPLP